MNDPDERTTEIGGICVPPIRRSMNDQDCNTITSLNKAVRDAIATRRNWLDSKMPEYAKVAVGQELYDLNTGALLGIVAEHYRYWRDQNEGVLDTSMAIEYRYREYRNVFGNTSSQTGLRVGTCEQAIEEMEQRVRRMKK